MNLYIKCTLYLPVRRHRYRLRRIHNSARRAPSYLVATHCPRHRGPRRGLSNAFLHTKLPEATTIGENSPRSLPIRTVLLTYDDKLRATRGRRRNICPSAQVEL